MAVKKTAAEQNAENTVSASLHRASPAFLFTSARPFWLHPEKHDLPLRCCGGRRA